MILIYICAFVTRILFIVLSLIGIWRVTKVKDDNLYWCLSLLWLPLILEMFVRLKVRKGKIYRRFSPTILLFIFTIVPSIWILELHHQQNLNKEQLCIKFHSWEDVRNITISMKNHQAGQGAGQGRYSVCPEDWILGLHQALLILLILGKWLLPLGGGITRDELSQLLLIFVGTAADILEFSTETLSDVEENSPELVKIILAVWTLSMMQFPIHLAVVKPEESYQASDSLLARHSTDMWSVMESLFMQDGPFLAVRLTVIFHYHYFHLMLLFFTAKNFLVVILNLYRLAVIYHGYRKKHSSPTDICAF